MSTQVVIDVRTTNKRIEFGVAALDKRPFVLNSFLVVDPSGHPVWEFVRREFEVVDDVEIAAVMIDVWNNAFSDALDAEPWGNQQRGQLIVSPDVAYEFLYGSVPVGHKQTIPVQGLQELAPDSKYRAIAFSSIGNAAVSFGT